MDKSIKNYMLDKCNCKGCPSSNSCYQQGKAYSNTDAECKDQRKFWDKETIRKARMEF